ncbi:MAG TPA: hypothetical protein VLL98_01515 [Rickettsiales bacterium]|nr:hypothetical protein [Rickettsiales bacterium]
MENKSKQSESFQRYLKGMMTEENFKGSGLGSISSSDHALVATKNGIFTSNLSKRGTKSNPKTKKPSNNQSDYEEKIKDYKIRAISQIKNLLSAAKISECFKLGFLSETNSLFSEKIFDLLKYNSKTDESVGFIEPKTIEKDVVILYNKKLYNYVDDSGNLEMTVLNSGNPKFGEREGLLLALLQNKKDGKYYIVGSFHLPYSKKSEELTREIQDGINTFKANLMSKYPNISDLSSVGIIIGGDANHSAEDMLTYLENSGLEVIAPNFSTNVNKESKIGKCTTFDFFITNNEIIQEKDILNDFGISHKNLLDAFYNKKGILTDYPLRDSEYEVVKCLKEYLDKTKNSLDQKLEYLLKNYKAEEQRKLEDFVYLISNIKETYPELEFSEKVLKLVKQYYEQISNNNTTNSSITNSSTNRGITSSSSITSSSITSSSTNRSPYDYTKGNELIFSTIDSTKPKTTIQSSNTSESSNTSYENLSKLLNSEAKSLYPNLSESLSKNNKSDVQSSSNPSKREEKTFLSQLFKQRSSSKSKKEDEKDK